jgi:signal transduction histidine kinase
MARAPGVTGSSAPPLPVRFGYRLKVPLALTAVALVSGIGVASTTYMLVDRQVEANAEAETQRLAGTLARALAQPVLRNDVWQAYQTLLAASGPDDDGPADRRAQVILLDAQARVFASPSPRAHPIGTHVGYLSEPLRRAAAEVLATSPPRPSGTAADDRSLVLAVPVVGDEDTLLGIVLASHPRTLAQAQRSAVVRELVGLGAVAALLVALAGGVLGLTMTAPLNRLRAAMQALPSRESAGASARTAELAAVSRRSDEVGELARTFSDMMAQLTAQQELERHVLEAERMASIGQLSAGIAHEVNNPLGGMLAAIENRRLRGQLDEPTERTFALIERGLRQVHDTVQALLNEGRSERRPMAASDLHDLELLVRPEADRVGARLAWSLGLPDAGLLPAVPVRQVVLNLTLNAIAAAGPGGTVDVRAEDAPEGWRVRVANTGAALDGRRLAALVQGSERSADGRVGLGLWITARILHTLGGALSLAKADAPFATALVAAIPWLNAVGWITGPGPVPEGAPRC